MRLQCPANNVGGKKVNSENASNLLNTMACMKWQLCVNVKDTASILEFGANSTMILDSCVYGMVKQEGTKTWL
jgi:hypothetical protein